MSGGTLAHRVQFLVSCLIAALVLSAGPVASQSRAPTIVDFWTNDDALFLEINLNAEAIIAGLDPVNEPDLTSNRDYGELRALVSSELEPRLKAFAIPWMDTLQVQADGPVKLSYEGARIPVVGDVQNGRISKLLLAGPLPVGASGFQMTWPVGHGPVVLRQQRVSAPYTGYLDPGETSPVIPLQGGAALSTQQTLLAFFTVGFTRVLPERPQLVLLALSLVFLALQLRPVLVQTVLFSFAVFAGLTLGVSNVLSYSAAAVAYGVSAAVVVLSIWNLIFRRLRIWRVLAVVAAGTLAGGGVAFTLLDIGVPPDHLPPALLGFGAGIVSAVCLVISLAFVIAILLAGRSHRLRGRISVLASMLIAGIGLYWIIGPLVFA